MSCSIYDVKSSLNTSMSVIHVYQTPQAVHLTQGTGSPNQNYPVNRSDFRLLKGVRNEIEVFVKDLDRKPVSMNGKTPVMRIVDRDRQHLLMETELEVVDVSKGRFRLVVDPGVDLPLGSHIYSVLVETTGQYPTVLYTDRDRTPFGVVEVLEGPVETPAPSTMISRDQMLLLGGSRHSTALPGAALVGNRTGLHTALFYLTGFTGSITIQASLEAQPTSEDLSWFDVDQVTVSGFSGLHPLTFEGMFVWVRFIVYENQGTVDKVFYRN